MSLVLHCAVVCYFPTGYLLIYMYVFIKLEFIPSLHSLHAVVIIIIIIIIAFLKLFIKCNFFIHSFNLLLSMFFYVETNESIIYLSNECDIPKTFT